jgi:ABC-2 type transport system ATP-binding protein
MSDAAPHIEATGLRKNYGSRVVLDDLSLSVNSGEVVGLLGPNGAGKTTTLMILATLLKPDAGEVRLGGTLARPGSLNVRRQLGFVPQSIALYPSLSGRQNLDLFARLHGMGAQEARREGMLALEEVGLGDRADDTISELSGGMQRRLNLACGLVHRPQVLLLDEPAVGVDPQSRERILLTVRRMAEAGAAVVYSTHYMDEVERLCSRVLLIDHGRMVANGTVPELIVAGGRRIRMEIVFEDLAPTGWLGEISDVHTISQSIDGISLELASMAQVSGLLERARGSGAKVREFRVHSPNLSDAFMSLTGHALRDPDAGSH